MSRVLRGVPVALIAITMISFASAQTDSPGAKGYPGLSRLPGSYIDSYKEAQFDSFTFTITEAGKDKKQPVEGQAPDRKHGCQEGQHDRTSAKTPKWALSSRQGPPTCR
jgi:hypothetical protein